MTLDLVSLAPSRILAVTRAAFEQVVAGTAEEPVIAGPSLERGRE